jgi:2Fe-2S ferredoxin
MPRVTFIHPEGKSGDVEADLSLLEAAEQMGFPLNHDCGGNASCTTCRVDVLAGLENLSDVDFDEQDLLDREALIGCWGMSSFRCPKKNGIRHLWINLKK